MNIALGGVMGLFALFIVLMIIIEIVKWKMLTMKLKEFNEENIKNLTTPIFEIDNIFNNDIITRGGKHEATLFECDTHGTQFVLKDKELYRINDIERVRPLCKDQEIKHVKTCQILRDEYGLKGLLH